MIKNNTKNISICFLSHSSGTAGAEKAFPKLLKGLTESNIKINVLLPSIGPIEKILKKINIQYNIINYSRWLNPKSGFLRKILRTLKNIIMVLPILRFIKKNNNNLVYTNTSTILSGALAAKILGIPHIWHFREFGYEDYGYHYDIGEKATHYLLNKLSTVCFVNSKAVKDKYSKFISPDKIILLYEAYEIDSNVNIEKDNIKIIDSFFNLIIVGTLHEAKGHKDAIHALYLLKLKGIKAILHIVGDGSLQYKDELLELINHYEIRDNVIFYGYLENPVNLIKKSDILLMCSRNEAFGLVTLEAMKSGIPVIGSNSGGTNELIIDGFNGYLYTPNNTEELAEKITFLFLDRLKLKTLGANAKIWSNDNFIPGKYIADTINEINNIIN